MKDRKRCKKYIFRIIKLLISKVPALKLLLTGAIK